jgi:hypothetical protein
MSRCIFYLLFIRSAPIHSVLCIEEPMSPRCICRGSSPFVAIVTLVVLFTIANVILCIRSVFYLV